MGPFLWAKEKDLGRRADPRLRGTGDEIPNSGANHSQWRADRTDRLSRPAYIRITLESIRWQAIDDNRYQASFVQHYESGTYRDTVSKTLQFLLEDSDWKIVSEQSS